MNARRQVAIAGGGFAGLETAFLLQHRLHGAVDITVVSDKDYFVFRPNTIYIPFGADPAQLNIPLAHPTDRRGIKLVEDRVAGVDPERKQLELEHGSLPYDWLVIATGRTCGRRRSRASPSTGARFGRRSRCCCSAKP